MFIIRATPLHENATKSKRQNQQTDDTTPEPFLTAGNKRSTDAKSVGAARRAHALEEAPERCRREKPRQRKDDQEPRSPRRSPPPSNELLPSPQTTSLRGRLGEGPRSLFLTTSRIGNLTRAKEELKHHEPSSKCTRMAKANGMQCVVNMHGARLPCVRKICCTKH